jgi:type I restriction enzyme, S subunit
MIKVQKSVTSSQLPKGYKQTEVGVIPEDWDVNTIGQSMNLLNGRAFRPIDWVEQGIPIIRIQNLNDSGAPFNYCRVDTKIEDKHRIEFGDIVFAWSGTKGTSFGARIWTGIPGVLNQHIFKVVPDKRKLVPHYAFLILLNVQEEIEKQAHGFKASFVHVKKSDLVGVNLPVPSIPEQDAIAHALSDIDALIESLDRLLTKKRQIKQGAMQELLTGKSRIPVFSNKQCYKQTEIGMIPDDWNIQRIGDFCTCFSGGTPSTSNPSYYGGDITWITSSDLNETRITDVKGRISVEGLTHSAAKLVESQTLLLAMYGATAGVCAITEICGAINQAILAIKPSGVNLEYLFQYLLFRKDFYINTYTQGGQPNFSGEIVKSFLVSFPAFEEEQLEIATILSDMDAEIDSIEAKLTKTRQIKQGMMHELLTGRIRLI